MDTSSVIDFANDLIPCNILILLAMVLHNFSLVDIHQGVFNIVRTCNVKHLIKKYYRDEFTWSLGAWLIVTFKSGLILGLRPANKRRRYFVTTSLIGWAQTQNQPCKWFCSSAFYFSHTGRAFPAKYRVLWNRCQPGIPALTFLHMSPTTPRD